MARRPAPLSPKGVGQSGNPSIVAYGQVVDLRRSNNRPAAARDQIIIQCLWLIFLSLDLAVVEYRDIGLGQSAMPRDEDL